MGGEIAIALPTDPGIANRAIKSLVTYRKLRKNGISDPRLWYAQEHRNPVNNIVAVLRSTFRDSPGPSYRANFHYLPFRIPSWNLSPLCIFHAIRTH